MKFNTIDLPFIEKDTFRVNQDLSKFDSTKNPLKDSIKARNFKSVFLRNNNRIPFLSDLICILPTVYILHNTYHDKYYVGQTMDFHHRLLSHTSDLIANKHRNIEFQQDYNLIKEQLLDPYQYIKADIFYQRFITHMLPINDLKLLAYTLELKEQQFIGDLVSNGKTVYNVFRKPVIPVMVDGQFYISKRFAARSLGIKFDTLQSRVLDSGDPDCYPVSLSSTQKLSDAYGEDLENDEDFSYDDDQDIDEEYDVNPEQIVYLSDEIRFNDPVTKEAVTLENVFSMYSFLNRKFKDDPELEQIYANYGIKANYNSIIAACNRKNSYFTFTDINRNDTNTSYGKSKVPVVFEGKRYDSYSEAAKKTGFNYNRVRAWCNSKTTHIDCYVLNEEG